MNRLLMSVAMLSTVCLLACPNAIAQKGNRGYGRIYNPATVETVSGQVAEVEQTVSGKAMGRGVHLVLTAGQETVSVHLGPSWFMTEQALKIEKGDKITVTGSRVEYNGKPAIIASEVGKGGEVLKLRDATGVPLWAGWRRK